MDIKVPRLAEGVDSATVANILVSEGATIERDQVILELETEKAVGPIPAPGAGKVTKIHVKSGDQVQVGQVLISVAAEGAPGEVKKDEPVRAPVKSSAAPVAPAPVAEIAITSGAEAHRYESRSGFPPPAAPSVRKMAQELGIDLARVRGSEGGGRITLQDLKTYIAALQGAAAAPAPSRETVPQAAAKGVDFSKWGPVEKKRMSALRRTVAERMVESWTTIPHITQMDETDITNLLALMKKYGPRFEKKGTHLTFTPLAMKAAVAALKKYPIFNSSFDEATGEIVYKRYYHLGVAVDTDAGLIVPVVHDVDQKTIFSLSLELNTLVDRTRQRKVSLEELQGGTFSISNQGGIGGGHFTPIVNKPEVAVLGVGRARLKPVVRDKKTETRMMLPLALSYDHRVIDGANAVRFVRELAQALENFSENELKE
jgi:pyruvate dehydrogenase E2 component (dihydrolipoamide acetyltransferase)